MSGGETGFHVAMHTAGNRAKKGDLAIIIAMLFCVIMVPVLFSVTPLTFYGSVIVVGFFCIIFLVPLLIVRARRSKARLDRLRLENVQKYQKNESAEL